METKELRFFFSDGGASVSLVSRLDFRRSWSDVSFSGAVLSGPSSVGSASLRGANGGVASVGSTANSAGGCGSEKGGCPNRTLRRWS